MTDFTMHTVDTAPEASRPLLEGAKQAFGFIPNLQKVFAESPALLEGYMTLWGLFEKTSFTPVERHIVYLAINYENRCHYCMAGHSGLAKMAGVSDADVQALRDGQPLADPKHEALRQFAAKLVAQRGWLADEDVQALLSAGYDQRAVLEVILGAAVKLMSNYTNHLAQTPVDEPMKAMAWTHPDQRLAAE
ncbi:MAG: carboxymuconolactone decarboxylase family protein [Rhodothalassiaceae bacterium]